ncbi:hypothetical protein DGMP_04280 [Desulfomarina profundi]|uniref:Ankyrin repeat domain-containing protein n=1 Tax=Desulfomarina profundi TaxID=2772557 RepID=A0A8D5JN45_9BACT|nr:ankyrin repeat domain-containing protein [Desulfomarina profundi]BCL59735.1 hypothetical protein DGMP_04280 [Desulfomarina profundi]
MKYFSVLLFLLFFVCCVEAAELTGKITGIKGDMIFIEMSTKKTPDRGDPVLIVLDLDGEIFEAGKAWVYGTGQNSQRIIAKMISGTPSIDMTVSIPHEQYKLDRQLYQAIKAAKLNDTNTGSSVEQVRQALRNGADVNKIWFENDKYPLVHAVTLPAAPHDQKEIVRELIKAGANQEAIDTALPLAVYNKEIELIKLLLHSGADVNTKMSSKSKQTEYQDPSSGATPLIIAAAQQEFKIVRMLLEAGADINATNAWGETALFFAEKKEDARLLINAGANVNATNHQGDTPLFYLAGISGNQSSADGAHPWEAVAELIQAGTDVNVENKFGQTAIFYSAPQSTRLLIESGAEINHKDSVGSTPVFWQRSVDISSLKDISSLCMLLNADAEIKSKTTAEIPAEKLEWDFPLSAGSTALMRAAADLDLSVARILILAGADVAAKNASNQTALTLAKRKADKEIPRLQKEEKTSRKILENEKPVTRDHIDWRKEKYNRRITDIKLFIEILQNSNPVETVKKSMEVDLFKAIEKKENDYARLLLRYGVNPNTKNKKDETILFRALMKMNLQIVPALIAAGADVNQPVYGVSPLLGAAWQGDRKMVKVFLQAGAELNFKFVSNDTKRAGMTPLMAAAAKGHKEVVSLLLEAGADSGMRDKQGRRAIDHARKNNHAGIVRLLTPDS